MSELVRLEWEEGWGRGGLFENVQGIGAHHDMHVLFRHMLTSNLLGFLTDIVVEAYKISLARSIFGTGGASAEGFLFLDHLIGHFAVIGTCPRSLGKNDKARCSSALKSRVNLAIVLVHD